jgi:hypothetical protein
MLLAAAFASSGYDSLCYGDILYSDDKVQGYENGQPVYKAAVHYDAAAGARNALDFTIKRFCSEGYRVIRKSEPQFVRETQGGVVPGPTPVYMPTSRSYSHEVTFAYTNGTVHPVPG